MMNRPEDALGDLANPAVGEQHDASLWRALAYARQGKWSQAREGFKTVEAAIATLPIELQRVALKDEMRAAIEVRDFSEAENELNDLETIGVPHDMQPPVSVLIGRLDEGLGRPEDALNAYRTAANSWDRPAAAQGQLRETLLRYSLGDLKRDEVISDLESLTTIWRGDETEIEALKNLARLYTEEGRYRDSFYVMRSAMAAHPDWDMTRKIQEEAAKTFDALFLAGKGDTLPAVDALALVLRFPRADADRQPRRRDDPPPRRPAGIRRPARSGGRAVAIPGRQPSAGRRARQVATRLAVIYLMDRKPDRALATLQASRTGDLSTELRDQRLLLEARALSDTGRHDFALEVIASVTGREAIRLRSDIYWAARQMAQVRRADRTDVRRPLEGMAAADRRRALRHSARRDRLCAGRGHARAGPIPRQICGEDGRHAGRPQVRHRLGAARHSRRRNSRTSPTPRPRADTLDDFLRDMRARYSESNPVSPASANDGPPPPGAAPAAGKAATPAPAGAPAAQKTVPAPQAAPAPASSSATPGRTAQR